MLKFPLVLLVALALWFSVNEVSAQSVEKQLLADIKRAEKRLTKIERQQLAQRKALSRSLAALEREVATLRDKTAHMQRQEDEKTLALDDLQKRLQQWQRQQAYQRHALYEYLQAHSELPQDADFSQSLEAITTIVSRFESRLSPQWVVEKTIASDGQLQEAAVLRLGPVSWMYEPVSGRAGLLSDDVDIAAVQLDFDQQQSEQLAGLYRQGKGIGYFDPSLSRAVKLSQQRETVLQHLGKGGIWVIPILLCAVVALLCALLKTLTLWRLPRFSDGLIIRIRRMLSNNDVDAINALRAQSRGSEARMLDICAQHPQEREREDALFNHLMHSRLQLEKGLGAIAVIAAIAPLLGLLGTVSGMIRTFKLMTLFGSGDASSVSGGISEALVTTELGLIVAIPALLLHALLTRWVKQRQATEEALAIELSQLSLPPVDAGKND